MAVKSIPDGHRSVTPYLMVKGAGELIGFLERAFGAGQVFRMDREDGTVGHAEVQLGDSRIMLAEVCEQWPSMPAAVHLYLDDCDATYRAALEAGAEPLMAPEDRFYGDRSAGVKDPWGNVWWLATHTEDVSMEELKTRAQAAAKA